MIKSRFDPTKFFITLLVIFVAVQSSIWVASQYIPEVEFIKMGWILMMMLSICAIISIFILGKKIGELRKEDLIFIFLEFGLIISAFIFLPQIIPEIFSTYSIQISELIKESVGSIISATGSGIGN